MSKKTLVSKHIENEITQETLAIKFTFKELLNLVSKHKNQEIETSYEFFKMEQNEEWMITANTIMKSLSVLNKTEQTTYNVNWMRYITEDTALNFFRNMDNFSNYFTSLLAITQKIIIWKLFELKQSKEGSALITKLLPEILELLPTINATVQREILEGFFNLRTTSEGAKIFDKLIPDILKSLPKIDNSAQQQAFEESFNLRTTSEGAKIAKKLIPEMVKLLPEMDQSVKDYLSKDNYFLFSKMEYDNDFAIINHLLENDEISELITAQIISNPKALKELIFIKNNELTTKILKKIFHKDNITIQQEFITGFFKVWNRAEDREPLSQLFPIIQTALEDATESVKEHFIREVFSKHTIGIFNFGAFSKQSYAFLAQFLPDIIETLNSFTPSLQQLFFSQLFSLIDDDRGIRIFKQLAQKLFTELEKQFDDFTFNKFFEELYDLSLQQGLGARDDVQKKIWIEVAKSVAGLKNEKAQKIAIKNLAKIATNSNMIDLSFDTIISAMDKDGDHENNFTIEVQNLISKTKAPKDQVAIWKKIYNELSALDSSDDGQISIANLITRLVSQFEVDIITKIIVPDLAKIFPKLSTTNQKEFAKQILAKIDEIDEIDDLSISTHLEQAKLQAEISTITTSLFTAESTKIPFILSLDNADSNKKILNNYWPQISKALITSTPELQKKFIKNLTSTKLPQHLINLKSLWPKVTELTTQLSKEAQNEFITNALEFSGNGTIEMLRDAWPLINSLIDSMEPETQEQFISKTLERSIKSFEGFYLLEKAWTKILELLPNTNSNIKEQFITTLLALEKVTGGTALIAQAAETIIDTFSADLSINSIKLLEQLPEILKDKDIDHHTNLINKVIKSSISPQIIISFLEKLTSSMKHHSILLDLTSQNYMISELIDLAKTTQDLSTVIKIHSHNLFYCESSTYKKLHSKLLTTISVFDDQEFDILQKSWSELSMFLIINIDKTIVDKFIQILDELLSFDSGKLFITTYVEDIFDIFEGFYTKYPITIKAPCLEKILDLVKELDEQTQDKIVEKIILSKHLCLNEKLKELSDKKSEKYSPEKRLDLLNKLIDDRVNTWSQAELFEKLAAFTKNNLLDFVKFFNKNTLVKINKAIIESFTNEAAFKILETHNAKNCHSLHLLDKESQKDLILKIFSYDKAILAKIINYIPDIFNKIHIDNVIYIDQLNILNLYRDGLLNNEKYKIFQEGIGSDFIVDPTLKVKLTKNFAPEVEAFLAKIVTSKNVIESGKLNEIAELLNKLVSKNDDMSWLFKTVLKSAAVHGEILLLPGKLTLTTGNHGLIGGICENKDIIVANLIHYDGIIIVSKIMHELTHKLMKFLFTDYEPYYKEESEDMKELDFVIKEISEDTILKNHELFKYKELYNTTYYPREMIAFYLENTITDLLFPQFNNISLGKAEKLSAWIKKYLEPKLKQFESAFDVLGPEVLEEYSLQTIEKLKDWSEKAILKKEFEDMQSFYSTHDFPMFGLFATNQDKDSIKIEVIGSDAEDDISMASV